MAGLEREKKLQIIVDIFKLIVTIIIFTTLTFLFYRQAVGAGGVYRSDLPSHISFAVKGTGYSILYVAIGALMELTNNVLSVAILEAVLVVGTVFLANKILLEIVPTKFKNITFFISFGTAFLGSIYIPHFYEQYYMSTLITQPWHNITYFGMRLFAVLTVYLFYKMYDSYLEEIKFKDWFWVAGCLTLATSIKPNFLITFAFSLLIILIIDFFKNFGNKKIFFNIVKMGTVVFPACLVLLWQSTMLYAPQSDSEKVSGIAIAWFASFIEAGLYKNVFKIITGLSFPIFVFICNRKTFEKKDWFTYLMYVVTYIEVYMLKETGYRENHGNFFWGLMCSAYILFVYTIGIFLKNFSMKGKKEIAKHLFGCLLLTLHLISGLVYFMKLLGGAPFGI